MKKVLNYIILLIILILFLILFNFCLNIINNKIMQKDLYNKTMDTFNLDVCKNNTYKSSIKNYELKNEDVLENETIGYISFISLKNKPTGPINQGDYDDDQILAMKNGVSHDPKTAMPGQDENVVIAGHREMLFKNLKDLKNGDVILININNNIYLYEVYETKIVDPEKDLQNATNYIFEVGDSNTLTLYTCYPFEWYKAYPYRKVIKAKSISSYKANCSGGINDEAL